MGPELRPQQPAPATNDAGDILRLAEAAADQRSRHRERDLSALKGSPEAVDRALTTFLGNDPGAALRLVAALPAFWEDTGRVAEGRLFTDQAVDGWTGPPTAAFANALVAAAQLAFRQGDQHGAVERCERAIAAAEASATPAAAAMAHVNLARVAFRDGRADDIERHARIALDLGGSDAGAQRGGLHMLGWAAHTAGDLDLAMRRFEESLAFRRSLGDRFGVTVELANLADLAAERGDHPAAARQLRDALATARELESAYLVLNLLPSIAAIAAASGDWDSAARLMGATDAMTASSGLEPDPGAWQQAIDDAAASYGTAFARARSAGRRLEAEEAADLGMRVASTIGREPATG